jgi:hypothetical protein
MMDGAKRRLADRIQARAVSRMGMLLKQFNAQGRRTDQLNDGAIIKLSQQEAAEKAGISEHQRVQAIRVANIPTEKFEAAIEQQKPARSATPRPAANSRGRRSVKEGSNRSAQTAPRGRQIFICV